MSSLAPASQPTSTALGTLHRTFLEWLGDGYDLDAINVVLATAAAERLNGDPLWLLLISGSGNAKTETVCSLAGAGAIITSTIASDGALLSATPKRDKSKDAHGGLLRRLGNRGVLVIKDVTSILSMSRDMRAMVLAALREIHDQRWERNVGSNGGLTLTWTGRIAVIGACTTAWDRAYDVVASMGDRFVVLRMDSSVGRQLAGYKAIANTGDEARMRTALSEAAAEVLQRVRPNIAIRPMPAETDQLLAAADVVALCRTGVDYAHYRHRPEPGKTTGASAAWGLRHRPGSRRRAAVGASLRAGFDAAAEARDSRRRGDAPAQPDARHPAAAQQAADHRRPSTPGVTHARRADVRRDRGSHAGAQYLVLRREPGSERRRDPCSGFVSRHTQQHQRECSTY